MHECYLRVDGKSEPDSLNWDTMAMGNYIEFELLHLLHHLNGAAFNHISINREGCYKDEGMDVMPRLNPVIFDIIEVRLGNKI